MSCLPCTVCSRAVLALLSFGFLLGADGCPLEVNPQQPGAGGGTAVDVGGSSGALWQVLFEDQVVVTMRTATQVAARQTTVAGGPVTLLGGTLDVASLCWRSDIVCPHQVLPARVAILQSSASPGTIALGFNRRGPLAALPPSAAGLAGQLDGKELSVPLAVGEATRGSCALGASSIILATASAASGSGERADSLRGRATVGYDGACISLGGSGALEAETRVELAMPFAAKRE